METKKAMSPRYMRSYFGAVNLGCEGFFILHRRLDGVTALMIEIDSTSINCILSRINLSPLPDCPEPTYNC